MVLFLKNNKDEKMNGNLLPLKQSEFSMEIINDLGLIEYGSNGNKARYAIFKCSCCLKEFKKNVSQVKSNTTGMCRDCKRSKTITKHGDSKLRINKIWNAILYRCNDKYNKYYGGKGISVEFDDYLDFKNWSMKNGYNDSLTIDRIDSNKNYSKDNCRWVDRNVQARNTILIHSSNTAGYRGVSFDKKRNKFVVQIKVKNKNIYLGSYSNPIDGAIAYDNFVVSNSLEHTLNFKEKA